MIIVFPQFEELILEMGVTLPGRTRFMISCSRVVRFFDLVPIPILLVLHAAIASGVAYLSFKGTILLQKQNLISPKRFGDVSEVVLIVGMGVVVGLILSSLFLPPFPLPKLP